MIVEYSYLIDCKYLYDDDKCSRDSTIKQKQKFKNLYKSGILLLQTAIPVL